MEAILWPANLFSDALSPAVGSDSLVPLLFKPPVYMAFGAVK